MDKNKAYEMARLAEMAYLDTFEFQKAHSDRRFCFHSVNGTQFYTVWTDTELTFTFRGTESGSGYFRPAAVPRGERT